MRVIENIEDMKSFSRGAKSRGRTIAFVPTMGCLHEAHLELVRQAKASGDVVVLSVFVNPTQFGPGEDFLAYPIDMERDKELSREAGVDAFFCPQAKDIYPQGYGTFVEVAGALTENLCARSRPGHFRGVATIVLKLFNIVMPDKAFFGLKDFQQQLVIKRLVRDLALDVEITTVPVVREADGLAMSSRNRRLSAEERQAASVIPRILGLAKDAFLAGERTSSAIIERAAEVAAEEPLVEVDYIAICDPATLEEIDSIEDGEQALFSVAVRIGGTRLIDNCMLERECDSIKDLKAAF